MNPSKSKFRKVALVVLLGLVLCPSYGFTEEVAKVETGLTMEEANKLLEVMNAQTATIIQQQRISAQWFSRYNELLECVKKATTEQQPASICLGAKVM